MCGSVGMGVWMWVRVRAGVWACGRVGMGVDVFCVFLFIIF